MIARSALLLLVACLVACRGGGATDSVDASAPADARPAAFEGRWESTTTSRGGVGAVLDLAADGTMTGGLAVLVGSKWTLLGSRLQFKTDDGGANETDVSFDGGTMNVVHGGAPGRHRRVGAATPGAPPVVGVWTYPHPAGGTAFERYAADGRMEFRLGMPGAARGTWSAAGDTLTIETGGSRRVFDVKRAGDVLTLTDGGRTNEYRRAERWYPFPAVFKD